MQNGDSHNHASGHAMPPETKSHDSVRPSENAGTVPAARSVPQVTGTKWVCPMHAQIVRSGPGSCPICGMSLEPMVAMDGEDVVNPELREMWRRFVVAAGLTLPILLIAMADLRQGAGDVGVLSVRNMTLLQLALATPVCLWAAWPFYSRALLSVRNRQLNMFTLIGLPNFAKCGAGSSSRLG